jgi:hypothetical protein
MPNVLHDHTSMWEDVNACFGSTTLVVTASDNGARTKLEERVEGTLAPCNCLVRNFKSSIGKSSSKSLAATKPQVLAMFSRSMGGQTTSKGGSVGNRPPVRPRTFQMKKDETSKWHRLRSWPL